MHHAKSILSAIARHKVLAGIVVVAIGVGATTWMRAAQSDADVTRYVLVAVERGTMMTTVSGSGQVTAAHQVDVKAKAAGDAIAVLVTEGQSVRAGAVLVQLDARDAQKAVRDAQANLDAATLALEKLQRPADALTMLQAENALVQARTVRQSAEDDLQKAYDDAFTAIANAFLDLPGIVTALRDVLYASTVGSAGQWNMDVYADAASRYDNRAPAYRKSAADAYDAARTVYDRNYEAYKAASRYDDRRTIDALLRETYETSRRVTEALKGATNLIQFYKDQLALHDAKAYVFADTHLATLAAGMGKANAHVAALLNIIRAIQTDTETIAASDRAIAERAAALAKLRAGADALDIASQELTVRQRQNAFQDAREKFADATVRAPFDGILAALPVERGDTVSVGAVVATVITNTHVAAITLNEVDVAQVREGQHATLTFDAVPDLTITGTVAAVDTLGTVAQGVVSYAVEVTFDTQDPRVKPGMSVTAAIITAVRTDVLSVPNAAVKTVDGATVVEVPDAADADVRPIRRASGVELRAPPRRQAVTVGMVNETRTEITDGLADGDVVIVSTTAPRVSTSSAAPAAGGFRFPDVPGGGSGGGAGRFAR